MTSSAPISEQTEDLFDCLERDDVPGALACLSVGADIHALNFDDQTPLHVAAQRGLIHVMRVLLEKGAAPNAKDFEGETPLHLAALNDQSRAIRLLLAHDADIDAKDNEGRTPLHHAILNLPENKALKAGVTLMLAGADYTARDKNHWDTDTLARRYGTHDGLQQGLTRAFNNRFKRTALHQRRQRVRQMRKAAP